MSHQDGPRPWTPESTPPLGNPYLGHLRAAAGWGVGVGLLLVVVGAGWWHSAVENGGGPWTGVVVLILGALAMLWGGGAALAFWVSGAALHARHSSGSTRSR